MSPISAPNLYHFHLQTTFSLSSPCARLYSWLYYHTPADWTPYTICFFVNGWVY